MAVTESPPAGRAGGGQEGGAREGSARRREPRREPAALTYAGPLPVVPVRARGLTIEGADGRRYLDCLSGAGSSVLGHNHPVVLEAIRSVLDSGAPLHIPDLTTPVGEDFTTELLRTLPGELADGAGVRFCEPGGADAVEAALELVRTATGRGGLLALSGAYHGMGQGALEASAGAQGLCVTRLPDPYDSRCPRGTCGDRAAGRPAEDLLPGCFGSDPGSGRGAGRLAGVLVEPVRDEGVVPVPDSWLRRIRELTAERGVPLIADEARTGLGRTGVFWAVGHSGIVPDVMVLSTAIGGGLPLAVVVHREELGTGRPAAPAGAFRGNQLALAAGAATMAYVRENRLAERAADLGDRMLRRLREFAAGQPYVGEVRGRGLMIGVELVDPGAAGPGCPGRAAGGEPADAVTGHVSPVAGGSGPVEDLSGGGGHDIRDRETADRDAGGCDCHEPDFGMRVPGGPAVGGPGPRGPVLHGTAGRTGPAHLPAPEFAAEVRRECLRRGLIVGLGGRSSGVIRLLPPLTVTDEQADAVLDRLTAAITATARSWERGGSARTVPRPLWLPGAGARR
ncbi:MAG TPA: aspartate aminotransferase family protein [Streptomyces sp.]|nr:aspartate aminotransferase family protein [Streptomyces sp.]